MLTHSWFKALSPLFSTNEFIVLLYGSQRSLYSHWLLVKFISTLLDPRTGDWLLMSSIYPTLVLFTTYLLIVRFGPKFMAEREAFSLKNTLVIYNFLLVILSGYMLIEVWFITPKSVASVSINVCQKGKFSRQVQLLFPDICNI